MNPRKALAALVAALVATVAVSAAFGAYAKKGNPIKDDPPPLLFADTAIAPLARQLDAQQAAGERAAARLLAAHPDAAGPELTRLALAQLPPPPGPQAQRGELALLHRVAGARTPAQTRAALWLGLHGKKDVWKLYATQYGQLAPPGQAKAAKALVKRTLVLATTLEDQAKARFARPAPYLADRSLPALRTESLGKTDVVSYPSKHTMLAFAALAVLTRLDPERAGELRRMAHQVAFSREYAGVHYPSDLAAGAFLGTLVGDVELHAAGLTPAPPGPPARPARPARPAAAAG